MSARWGGEPEPESWKSALINLLGLIACGVIVAIVLLGATSTT